MIEIINVDPSNKSILCGATSMEMSNVAHLNKFILLGTTAHIIEITDEAPPQTR